MEGDGFSDPRRRAARRSRGGTRGRGRGQQYSRGSQKRPTTNTKPRPAPNLGSNEYRFRRIEAEEEENAYDAGVDFHEAASQSMYDPTSNEDLQHAVNLSNELSADFSNLESVLASVPLWIRLGEHTRFALGVPEEDKIENYVDPVPSDDITDELNTSKNEPSEEFLKDLADLSFEDDHATSEKGLSQTEVSISNNSHPKKDEGRTSMSPAQRVKQESSVSQPEEPGDFDKWLDEI